jgi:hypothetical protein
MFTNPTTKKIEHKTAYIEKVDDFIFGCDAYKNIVTSNKIPEATEERSNLSALRWPLRTYLPTRQLIISM